MKANNQQPAETTQGEGITLTVTTGVTLSVEKYNQLQNESHRKLKAYQVIRHLCGGDARDFNKLEKILDDDQGHTLTTGIAIRVSEQDKDWLVPLAHSKNMTLGDFMQSIFDKWLAARAADAGEWVAKSAYEELEDRSEELRGELKRLRESVLEEAAQLVENDDRRFSELLHAIARKIRAKVDQPSGDKP